MSNVAVPSRAGNRVDLEAALEVADIQRPLLPDPWALAGSAAPPVDLVSVVVSAAASMVAEDVADSEEASKIVEVMVEVDEAASATKAAGASEAQTDTERRQMHQLDQAAHALPVLAVLAVVATAAEVVGMEALDHQIATAVVGMTRAVAVAHMMTDPADIAAALVVMETVTPPLGVSVAATWSR